MTEIRKQLSDFQVAVITEGEKELAVLNELLEKAKQKNQMAIGLILDAHGVLGKQVSLDSNTKELVITVPDETQ